MLLRTVALLDGSGQPLASGFAGRGAQAGKVGRSLARSLVAQAVPDAAGYGDWFALANVKHYFKTLAIVAAQREFLRECYWLCAGAGPAAATAAGWRWNRACIRCWMAPAGCR
jgi:hypothetical protein